MEQTTSKDSFNFSICDVLSVHWAIQSLYKTGFINPTMMSQENGTCVGLPCGICQSFLLYITMYETKKSEYQCIPRSTDAD